MQKFEFNSKYLFAFFIPYIRIHKSQRTLLFFFMCLCFFCFFCFFFFSFSLLLNKLRRGSKSVYEKEKINLGSTMVSFIYVLCLWGICPQSAFGMVVDGFFSPSPSFMFRKGYQSKTDTIHRRPASEMG